MTLNCIWCEAPRLKVWQIQLKIRAILKYEKFLDFAWAGIFYLWVDMTNSNI